MTNEFMREERYIVFKVSDVVEHLTTTEVLHLERLYEIQRVGRKEAGKAELECVVVEKDWPEYEPTRKAIEARVTGAQPAPSVPDGYKLMPIEPTKEIYECFAAYDGTSYSNPFGFDDFVVDYGFALEAAPEVKP